MTVADTLWRGRIWFTLRIDQIFKNRSASMLISSTILVVTPSLWVGEGHTALLFGVVPWNIGTLAAIEGMLGTYVL